jgi:hypothetical protein
MKIIVFFLEIDYRNYIQYKRIMALKKGNGVFFFIANTNKSEGLYKWILPTINSNIKIRWERN